MKFEDLSPELQAKADACEAPEELLELAKEEGIELSDEDLENISGGWRKHKHRRVVEPNSTDQDGPEARGGLFV